VKAGDPSGRPIVSAPRNAAIALVRGRRVDQVAEAEVASLQERRDGRESVVARGQMRANARPAPVPMHAPRAAPAQDSARHSGPPPSGAVVHDNRSEATETDTRSRKRGEPCAVILRGDPFCVS